MLTFCLDAAVRMPDEFSRRIARNCPLILLGECNLDKVVDPRRRFLVPGKPDG